MTATVSPLRLAHVSQAEYKLMMCTVEHIHLSPSQVNRNCVLGKWALLRNKNCNLRVTADRGHGEQVHVCGERQFQCISVHSLNMHIC